MLVGKQMPFKGYSSLFKKTMKAAVWNDKPRDFLLPFHILINYLV